MKTSAIPLEPDAENEASPLERHPQAGRHVRTLEVAVAEERAHRHEGLQPVVEQGEDPAAEIEEVPIRRIVLEGESSGLRAIVLHEADPDVAAKFQALLDYARPDPEDELSRVIGDVAAHQVGEAARGFAHRVLVLDAGRLVEDSPAEAFFEGPGSEAGRRLMEMEREP